MAPMLSTFGGGSIRGFNPGSSEDPLVAEALANREILQPTFSASQSFYASGTSLSYSNEGVPSGWSGNGKEIKFSPDGSKLYYDGYSGRLPAQFSLSTNWDPTTATLDGDLYVDHNTAPISNTSLLFDVAMDGYHILHGDRENFSIWKTSTQWDFAGSGTITKIWDNYNTYTSDNLQVAGFTGDLKGVWVYGRNDDKLQLYTTATELDYANLGTTPDFASTGIQFDGSGSSNIYGMVMSGDGKAIIRNDYQDGSQHTVVALTTDYDLRTFNNGASYAFNNQQVASTGNMGLCIVRPGGLSSNVGYYYVTDNYGSGVINRNTFTWR